MKKILCSAFILMFMIIMLTGCSVNKIEFTANLGYDLNQIKYDNIAFNVYHSNTKNHNWELLTSFPCKKEPGYYSDVELQCSSNLVSIIHTSNKITDSKDKEAVSYDGTVEASYDLEVNDFDGFLSGYKSFDIKNKEGEQPLRLYPISNGDASFFTYISLDTAYDSDDANIDNILITIMMS